MGTPQVTLDAFSKEQHGNREPSRQRNKEGLVLKVGLTPLVSLLWRHSSGSKASPPPPIISYPTPTTEAEAGKTNTKKRSSISISCFFKLLHGAFVVKYMSGQHSDPGGDHLEFPLAAFTGREESPALFKQTGETSVSL